MPAMIFVELIFLFLSRALAIVKLAVFPGFDPRPGGPERGLPGCRCTPRLSAVGYEDRSTKTRSIVLALYHRGVCFWQSPVPPLLLPSKRAHRVHFLSSHPFLSVPAEPEERTGPSG